MRRRSKRRWTRQTWARTGCALVSAVNSLPALLAVALAVVLLSSVLLTLLNLVPPLVTMLWHVVSFNHARPILAE